MIFHAQPTEADYRHALVAHGMWVQQAAKKGGWRKKAFILVGIMFSLAMGLVGTASELFSKQEWVVTASSLLAALSFWPSVMVLILVQMAFRSASTLRPDPIGIIELPTKLKRTSSEKESRAVAGWVLLSAITLVLYLFLNSTSGTQWTVPSIQFNPFNTAPDNAAEPLIRHVPGAAIFWGCFMVGIILIALITTQQRRRAAKDMLISTPALLLPKTWECTEDGIAERGELLQTTMKWDYLRKFLETPTVVMLYPNEQTFYLIPRTAFTDEIEYARFIDFLMRKIPSGIMQPRGGQGFMVTPKPFKT